MEQEREVPEVATLGEDAAFNDAGRTEDEMLADILRSTDLLSDEEKAEVFDDESLPEDTEVEGDPDEDESEDPTEESESEDDVEDEVDEEADDEESDDDADEESATEEAQVFEEDDIDWEAMVPVTIDGETTHISLSELRKGYATEQHLSKKGRELGDTKKLIEEEREARLGEIEALAYSMNEVLGGSEQQLAQRYHAIESEIQKARDEGDTYKVQELKDTREIAQQQYWAVRQRREAALEQAAAIKQQAEVEQWNQKVQAFHEGITEVIPEYNEEYANGLREFGAELGLSEEFMLNTVDPTVVKALDDFRKLKQGVSTGAKKRAKAPVKKAPTKKPRSEKQKKASKENMTKARAFREDASADDQMAFLRDYAAKSLDQ